MIGDARRRIPRRGRGLPWRRAGGCVTLLAAYTPTLHLRRVDGRYFETYIESFERVWATGCPVDVGFEAAR